MTILVTGGAGFIGSAVVRRLIRTNDVAVVNLDALTYAGNPDSLAPIANDARHHFEHGNICDASAVRRIFTQYAPTCVIHLAAESHVDRSIDAPAAFVQTNIVGTSVLLGEALHYWSTLDADRATAFRFLHVSTDEVFGSLGSTGYFTESSAYHPSSPYSASKASADHLVRAWHRTYGLPVLITVCSNNYGPYQFPEKLIPHTILRALEGRTLPVYGDGGNVRDWLFVEDHVTALLRVLDAGVVGETYAIGGANEWRNIDVVYAICDLLDEMRPRSDGATYRSLVQFVADRPGHDARYAMDASRIRRELHWSASESFASGLRNTVTWYLEHSEWCQRIRSGSYRGERLGIGVSR